MATARFEGFRVKIFENIDRHWGATRSDEYTVFVIASPFAIFNKTKSNTSFTSLPTCHHIEPLVQVAPGKSQVVKDCRYSEPLH